ncbi:MAG: phenylpyruvate tautomerase MIF-related protein [Chitinispirillia bacterium]|jgi:hypothetical protein
MPVITIRTNVSFTKGTINRLLLDLSHKAAAILGKDKNKVLASYQHCEMTCNGTNENAAFIDVQSINGAPKNQCSDICLSFYESICRFTSIDPSRIYFNIFNVEPVSAWKIVEGKAVCPEDMKGVGGFSI